MVFELDHENKVMEEIIELVCNCGYEVQFTRIHERKTRFRNDYTFFDCWYGRKRQITVGMFNPKTGKTRYHYPDNLSELEKLITQK